MPNLSDFRAAERQLAQQLSQLETMKQDVGLQQEMVFNDKLQALMNDYDYSPATVLAILESAQD
jgi:hypothetical protein